MFNNDISKIKLEFYFYLPLFASFIALFTIYSIFQERRQAWKLKFIEE